ncbi:MAG: sialidase [Lachnospiraceae bacterium]|nr:sialidase [Lachnospiraceae bacterium]
MSEEQKVQREQQMAVLTKIGRGEDFHTEMFGENVYVFSPVDDAAQVQGILDRLWSAQEKNQFGWERYCVYFLPGEYDKDISVKVGYYMQVSGLGYLPDDTQIKTLNCDARWLGGNDNHNATCNFWRGVENLRVNSTVMWAVSQATFMRRMHITGLLYLHDNNGWASGGFLSDSLIGGMVDSGSQQQWLSRNCNWNGWRGSNWNIVFAGIPKGKTPTATWPNKQYTNVETVEEMQEKPFLVYDVEKGFGVFLPALRTDAVGISWQEAGEDSDTKLPEGEFIPLSEFYVARADRDNAQTLNAALQEGKHLFFTPGIYDLDEELCVDRAGSIVLGSGLATLRAAKGNLCMRVNAPEKTVVAGLLFDAGAEKSPLLFCVGNGEEDEGGLTGENLPPTLLADLFFRVGGARKEPTSVDVCAELNSDHIIGDNFWVWRADHGDGVGWDVNTAENGLIVNGDDVTIYALMVEHFRQYQTIWRGNNGKVIMYQSEIPYDVSAQSEFMSHDGTVPGFASYKVEDSVKSHTAIGIGIYSYNRDAEIEIFSAMEAPSTPDIKIHHVIAVMITGNPGITHVLNELGGPLNTPGAKDMVIVIP